MDCHLIRDAISAMLDEETPAVDPYEVEQHLETCPDCQAWRLAAVEVTRRTRGDVCRPVPRPP